MYRHNSKKQTQKQHEQSLDDFLKHLKKYNLKSQRYDRVLSPDPYAPYRQNTHHTLERSRTNSGNKSRKTNKTTRQRVEKILSGGISREKLAILSKDKSGNLPKQKMKNSRSKNISKSQSSLHIPNPADLISDFSKRIKYAQQYLQGKSKMGLLLCKKFLNMLNQIVENMVLNLQLNMQQLQKSISERLTKQIAQKSQKEGLRVQRKLDRLQRETLKLLQKENYHNNLIYHLRIQKIDIDKQFGKVIFGSDQFGGSGYGLPEPSSNSQESFHQYTFVKREKGPADVQPKQLDFRQRGSHGKRERVST